MDPWDTIATERRAFADLLETLSPEQWATRSLCAAWTVQEVATHTMVGPTGSLWSFVTAMASARGDFARANQVLVTRRMHRPTAAVVHDLREHAEHRFTPPGMDWHAPLTDLLVHRLDVTVPLRLRQDRPVEPWAPALDLLVSTKARAGFGTAGLPGLTFVATDLDWAHGTGPRVEASAADLALAIVRRSSRRLGELEGPGAATLRAWALSLDGPVETGDAVVVAAFAEDYVHWGLHLPDEAVVQRGDGYLFGAGWMVRWRWQPDGGLDLRASHRMTSDRWVRIFPDGVRRHHDVPSEHQVTLKDATQAQRDEAQREHSAAWRAYGDTVTAAGMDHYVRVDETPVTIDRSDPELMGWRLDDGPWHSARLRPT